MAFIAKIKENLHFYLCALFSLLLPLGLFVPFAFALIGINWIFNKGYKNAANALKSDRLILSSLLLYCTVLAGMLYTPNTTNGWFDVKTKLVLFLFPVVLTTSKQFTSRETLYIFLAFIAGCFLASMICLIRATFVYIDRSVNEFYYIPFSFLMHTGYQSMLISLSVITILIYYFSKFDDLSRGKKWSLPVLVIFFDIVLILLASKTALFFIALSHLIVLFWLLSQRKYRVNGLIMMLLLLAGAIIIPFVAPSTVNRMEQAYNSIIKNEDPEYGGTLFRKKVYAISVSIIKENVIKGVGTGGDKEYLVKKYKEDSMLEPAATLKLNAHNQFLQTFIENGVIGFFALLSIIVIPFIRAIKNKDALYLSFLMMIVFNFMTESVLEREVGNMFFSFFNSLFWERNINHSA